MLVSNVFAVLTVYSTHLELILDTVIIWIRLVSGVLKGDFDAESTFLGENDW